jgi:predicted nucleic acid-binding protein
MSGSARYTAILDACVLYPAPLRDLLLSLGQAGLYHARWTSRIQDEWVRSLLTKRPDLKLQDLARTCQAMNASILDCLVENYESVAVTLKLPDPDDHHVLAAAIAGHADAIVTFNLKDFPVKTLSVYNIEAQHPDDFIANQLDLRQLEALAAIKAMRTRLRNPPKTAGELIATFERNQLPITASILRTAEELI